MENLKALVNTKTNEILVVDTKETIFWGLYDDLQEAGIAVWKTVPSGLGRDDLTVDAGGNVVEDSAKVASRKAKVDAKSARRAAIKNAKSANSVASLRALVVAMAEDLGYDVD